MRWLGFGVTSSGTNVRGGWGGQGEWRKPEGTAAQAPPPPPTLAYFGTVTVACCLVALPLASVAEYVIV